MAEAVEEAAAPAAQQAAQPVGAIPPAHQGFKSKTEMFRERMAELKQKETAAASNSAAKAVAVPEEKEIAAAAKVDEAPKKKGCMSVILIAIGVAAAGMAAAWHSWI